jgi:hypothetical protein
MIRIVTLAAGMLVIGGVSALASTLCRSRCCPTTATDTQFWARCHSRAPLRLVETITFHRGNDAKKAPQRSRALTVWR